MPKDVLTSLSAGCVAGAVECCCTWPMEYIKTQLQTFRKVAGGPPPPFTGIGSGLVYTVRQHGFLALYTGLTPVLLFSMPKAGIRFGANQQFKNMLADPVTGKTSAGKTFLAGLGAGMCEGILVVTPQETIKTKLINLNKGFLEGVPYLLKTEGISGVYAGAVSTCLKQGGNQGSRFLFMGQYKQLYADRFPGAKMPSYLTFIGGLGAGLFSVICTAPFDVVKTRMQSTEAKNYSGTMDCFAQLLTKEGPLAFFNGAMARSARVVPGQGIIFMSADFFYEKLEPYCQRK